MDPESFYNNLYYKLQVKQPMTWLSCIGLLGLKKQPKTFFRHHYMFRTHPDINTARMTFNHQLSIEWQVCTPPHFNLQYTQHGLLL